MSSQQGITTEIDPPLPGFLEPSPPQVQYVSQNSAASNPDDSTTIQHARPRLDAGPYSFEDGQYMVWKMLHSPPYTTCQIRPREGDNHPSIALYEYFINSKNYPPVESLSMKELSTLLDEFYDSNDCLDGPGLPNDLSTRLWQVQEVDPNCPWNFNLNSFSSGVPVLMWERQASVVIGARKTEQKLLREKRMEILGKSSKPHSQRPKAETKVQEDRGVSKPKSHSAEETQSKTDLPCSSNELSQKAKLPEPREDTDGTPVQIDSKDLPDSTLGDQMDVDQIITKPLEGMSMVEKPVPSDEDKTSQHNNSQLAFNESVPPNVSFPSNPYAPPPQAATFAQPVTQTQLVPQTKAPMFVPIAPKPITNPRTRVPNDYQMPATRSRSASAAPIVSLKPPSFDAEGKKDDKQNQPQARRQKSSMKKQDIKAEGETAEGDGGNTSKVGQKRRASVKSRKSTEPIQGEEGEDKETSIQKKPKKARRST